MKALAGIAAVLALSIALPAGAAPARVQVVVTTADLALRLSRQPDLQFRRGVPSGVPAINIDDSVRYQRIDGIGAAMTDSAAWLLGTKLSRSARAAVMEALFGRRGIRIGFVRVPVAASDFHLGSKPYSYDDMPLGGLDPSLARFSVAHDRAYVLPVLRQMLGVNRAIKILASPWSPPGWMKTNQSMSNPNNSGVLLHTNFETYARYLVRFIQAYQSAGIPIYALTPQNEPTQATAYAGLDLQPTDEANFIVNELAPALRAASIHAKIFAFDWSWDGATYVRTLLSYPSVTDAVAGIAWHCYVGNPATMSEFHALYPHLEQHETECSPGIAPGPTGALVVVSIKNWASSVLLWNLALDKQGGPVEPPNSGCGNCTGLVTIDQRSGTFALGLDYYQLGQASRFVEPGARRIDATRHVRYRDEKSGGSRNFGASDLDHVAIENPDGGKVLLVYNNASRARGFAVSYQGSSFTYALRPGAMATFLWK